MNIKPCKKCGTIPYISKDRRSPSRAHGSAYYKPINDFYVVCPKCRQTGERATSSSALAVRKWNAVN